MYWQGKVAVVCGASSGLGRELVLALAQQRASKIVLVARGQESLDAQKTELEASFPETLFKIFCGDVCSQVDMRRLRSVLEQESLLVDLVIQAVGRSGRGAILELESAELRDLLEANVGSSLTVLRELVCSLRQPGGTIVFIGSLASHFTPRFLGGYAIAKHALAALAGQARLELAEKGIHVMLACPGPIARPDAGTRYAEQASSAVPAQALLPGGGAKLAGLNASLLARQILQAAFRRKAEIIRPRKARLLLILSTISVKLSDWILRQKTS